MLRPIESDSRSSNQPRVDSSFASDLLAETVFTFGVVAFAWLAGRDRLSSDAAAGLLLGALILTKPMTLIFAAAIPFALSNRSSGRPTTTILGVALAPMLVWVVRNLLVMGTPVLITSAGANLLIGNNPQATGGYSAPAVTGTEVAQDHEVESDRNDGRTAFAYIVGHPGREMILCARKLMLLASSEAELVAGTFASSDVGGRLRDRYRAVPLGLRISVSAFTLVILLAGALGLATSDGSTEERLFWALLAAIAASSLVFFGGSRFRFPLMPFLVLFGAEFATNAVRRLRSTTSIRRFAAAATCCAIVAIWIVEALVLAGAM